MTSEIGSLSRLTEDGEGEPAVFFQRQAFQVTSPM